MMYGMCKCPEGVEHIEGEPCRTPQSKGEEKPQQESWEEEFDRLLLKEVEKYGFMPNVYENITRNFKFGEPRNLKSFISSLLAEREEKVRLDERERTAAFLHKLAWSEDDIREALNWIERTPLRKQLTPKDNN